MKKYIFTSSLILASALSVMAESVVVEGGTSRTPLKAGYDNILKSGTGDKFAGDNGKPPVIASLDGATYKPAGDNWDIAYRAVVDINSDAEGDVMAVNFAGNKVNWRIGGFVVKNSNANASNTVATINLGSSLRFITNSASEFSGLDIQTNAKVEGNMSLTSQGGGSNFFTIAENCTVDYTAGVTYVAERGHIDVASGATLRHKGTIKAFDKSAINVAEGGRLEVANLSYENAPTVVANVAGTMVFTGTKATLTNVNLTGSVIAKDLELGTNGRLRFTGAELEFVAGTYNSTKGFWLNAVAVPEPAEWAMIFGGIALGLAIYRRRK